MTTPNQNQNAHNTHSKQQPQSYAAHAVATPTHHLNGTPNLNTTPRSVPSPAMARPGTASGFGTKHPTSSLTNTPQNTFTSHRVTPSQQQGGAGMARSFSQISNTSSTSQAGATIGLGVTSGLMGVSPANMLSFPSPAGLAALDTGTPFLGVDGSQAMGISLSDLGINSRRGNEDEERRAKLESVLAKLQGRKGGRGDPRPAQRHGRVSEEGVRRVGCWVGMDIEVEKKDKVFEGNRQIMIAGKSAVLIDVTFKNHLPTAVDVSFFSEDEAVVAHQAAASKVLLDDLKPPPGVAAINTKLDRFAANLEAIAKLDKLSVAGQLNCFEAITGVYTSLQKLYQHEKGLAAALFEANSGNKEALAEKNVICKRGGRPRMHARRKIGLSVEYWMEKRHSKESAPTPVKDQGAMDVDSTVVPNDQQDGEENSAGVYTLHLTAEANDPSLYSSLRVTSDWLSDRVHLPSAEVTDPTALLSDIPSIDWQDPPSTYLSSDDHTQASTADAMNTDHQQQKLPSARFVAKLEPPLAMPWTVANAILQSVAAQAGTDIDPSQTYTSILLRRSTPSEAPQTNNLPTLGGVSAVASAEKMVLCRGKDGGESETKQRTDLWIPKQEFGYVLRSIPFAHPRQIVRILPVLRQWARMGSLLMGTFLPSADSSPIPTQKQPGAVGATASKPSVDKMFSLAELLTPPDTPHTGDVEMSDVENTDTERQEKEAQPLAIDISLITTPSPALDIVFPLKTTPTGLASVSLKILENGEVVVLGQNLVEDESHEGKDNDDGKSGADNTQDEVKKKVKKIGKALEVTGDLGVWVEWLRREFG